MVVEMDGCMFFLFCSCFVGYSVVGYSGICCGFGVVNVLDGG